jgi:hypothetical protein
MLSEPFPNPQGRVGQRVLRRKLPVDSEGHARHEHHHAPLAWVISEADAKSPKTVCDPLAACFGIGQQRRQNR